ncbi:uncharacterized protein [Misgurnus anguillicaudatus]|uniref:uncharacterized protein n=1 Tax=Misgurnus anguillicaudatus TaxID=75329 RepID=UPI003CCFD064
MSYVIYHNVLNTEIKGMDKEGVEMIYGNGDDFRTHTDYNTNRQQPLQEDFVQKESGKDSIWIGLSDSDEKGKWKWVDGSTLTTRFWRYGEPSGGSGEHCALSYYSGCKVVKNKIQGMEIETEEMMVEIYESVDDFRTQTDSNTNNQQPQTTVHSLTSYLSSSGSERVMKRSYRSVTVCLVLLCVLLLTAVIVLCVLINTNNQQFNIKTKNITEERDQLLTKYTNITEERDQLLTKYTNITEERDQLLTKYTNITEERDQLLTKYTNITEERDQLLTKYTNITEKRDQLLTKYNNITEERNQLDGWIYYQSSLYFISSEQKNWNESRSYCKEKEADLIIINNKEEQDFIMTFGKIKVWIGLTNNDEEGRWKWVDGSTLTTRFWVSGEPSGGTKENVSVTDVTLVP